MSGRAGSSAADVPESTDIAAVFADLRQRLPPGQAERVRVSIEPSLAPIALPRVGLLQVLLSLVKNAFDATDGQHPVTLEGIRQEHRSGSSFETRAQACRRRS